MNNALILVDLQNDFLPGGALAVPDGDRVVPIANRLMASFSHNIATQDWHPANHGSFAANHSGRKLFDQVDLHGLPQVLWPVHCVQNTPGADFAPGLDRTRLTHITQKGLDPTIDSYSGFFDNGGRRATDLHAHLQQNSIRDLFVLGLATDYCVKFTALDARKLGYNVTLITDACRGVNLRADDVDRALGEMRAAGVNLTTSELL